MAAILLSVASVAWFAVAARSLLLFYPPVWPDEGLFADVAWSLATNGSLGNPLLAGMLPGIESHTYWMPPAYFIYLAGWLRLFGPDIAVIRLSSIALGLATLAIVFRMARRVASDASPTAGALAVTVLATQPAFIRGSLIGRMDLLSLLCGLAGVWACCVWLQSRTPMVLAVSVALAATALAAHPLGVVPLAIVLVSVAVAPASAADRRRAIAVALGIVAVAAAAWLWYGARDWTSFVAQLSAQMHRKAEAGRLPHRANVLWRWLGPDTFERLVITAVGAAGAIALIVGTLSRRVPLPFCLLMFLYPAAAVAGGEGWYAVFLLPAAAFGVAAMAAAGKRGVAITLALAAAVSGVVSEAALIAQAKHHDYRAWGTAVEQVLAQQPRGATVLLNSIPDPWPALLGRGLGVTVLQAPPAGIGVDTIDAAIARASLVISSDDIVSLAVAGRIAQSDAWRAEPTTMVGGYQLSVWRRR